MMGRPFDKLRANVATSCETETGRCWDNEMAEGSAMIRGLAGAIIWTDDLGRMVGFYRDTLGLTPHSERPQFVSFKWGSVKLGIGKHSGVNGASSDPFRVMVNLDVEDIHAVHERLSDAGVTIIRPPEREHWGGWVCTLTDPDGNILQLLEQPKDG